MPVDTPIYDFPAHVTILLHLLVGPVHVSFLTASYWQDLGLSLVVGMSPSVQVTEIETNRCQSRSCIYFLDLVG